MSKKEKSDHSKTMSNRFLMSKLVCRVIFDQFGTFSIFGLFFIKGTDEQEREVWSFWNHFQSISHVKIGLYDDFWPIWNIFDFRILFHQGNRWSRCCSSTVLCVKLCMRSKQQLWCMKHTCNFINLGVIEFLFQNWTIFIGIVIFWLQYLNNHWSENFVIGLIGSVFSRQKF